MSMKSFEGILMRIPEYRVLKGLMLYVPPVLIVLGTIGNVFSFIILRRRAMVKVSSYHYLASLAVADSLVLYIGLLRMWLGEVTGTDFHDSSDWVCKLTISLSYTASDLSVWLIIAVTVERYIVVCFPLRASTMINTRRAKRVIAFLALLMLTINLHFLSTVEVVEQSANGENVSSCQAGPMHEHLINEVWPWVDAFIYSFVPFIVILVLNILIVLEVVEARAHRLRMQNTSHGGGGGHHHHHHHLHHSSSHYHRQTSRFRPGFHKPSSGGAVNGGEAGTTTTTSTCRRACGPGEGVKLTIMLLTVSFAFLLTTLPMNVLTIVTVFWDHGSHTLTGTVRLKLAKTVAELLMYVNHSMNFCLYCATGQKFRQQIVYLLRALMTSHIVASRPKRRPSASPEGASGPAAWIRPGDPDDAEASGDDVEEGMCRRENYAAWNSLHTDDTKLTSSLRNGNISVKFLAHAPPELVINRNGDITLPAATKL